MAFEQVRLDQRPRFRIDLRGYVRAEDLLAEGGVTFFAHAAQELGRSEHQGRVAEDAQAVACHDGHEFDDVSR